MKTKTLHFKSKEAYRKWLAYEHMRTPTGKLVKAKRGRHSIAELSTAPRVYIGGHTSKLPKYTLHKLPKKILKIHKI